MIPFIDFDTQKKRIEQPINQAIQKVLDHGQYIMGPEVVILEEKLAKFSNTKHAIGCSSGTDALLLALMALNIKAGDAVFLPSFTFVSTAEAVCLLGATPVFVDVLKDTYNLSVTSLAKAYEKIQSNGQLKPAGIIAVDLFGQVADYPAINAFAKTNNLWVIADAAQSYGAQLNNQCVGQMADITTTSFFPAKPLGAFGDGGAVLTNSDTHANTLKSLRIHGKGSDKYDNIRVGINGRLDTIQAAILIEKLKIFDNEITQRNTVANLYHKALVAHVSTPTILPNNTSTWAQYSICLPANKDRTKIMQTLKKQGIPTAIYYPKPLHKQTAYAHLPRADDLSISDELSQTILSLPMSPYHEKYVENITCILLETMNAD